MEFRYCCDVNYDRNHLPHKKIKINEINNYFDNNLGFDHIILLSQKLKESNS